MIKSPVWFANVPLEDVGRLSERAGRGDERWRGSKGFDEKSKKQTSDQWQEETKRMRRSKEQYML